MEDDADIGLTSAPVVYEPFLKHIKNLGICGIVDSFFLSSFMGSLLLLNHDDGPLWSVEL